MPRSQLKKISDMLDLIESDELLQHKFAVLIVSAIENDLTLRDKVSEIVSREFASKLRGMS